MKKLFPLIIIMAILLPYAYAAVVPREFSVEVAKNNIPGHERVFKIGHNENVDTDLQLIWAGPEVLAYPFLTSATTMNVTSTDVDDTIAGVGARVVYIEGLDANYGRINETVNLNGQTRVSTTNSYLRINSMYVVSVGTNFTNNEGTIYLGTGATAGGVPTNVYYLIEPNYGRDHVGLYTVPANKTLVITSYTWTVFIGSSKRVENYLMAQPLFGTNRVLWRVWDLHSVDQFMDRTYSIPVNVAEKTDIYFIASTDVGTGAVSVSLNGYLIDNDVINDSYLDWGNGDPSFQETEVNSTTPIDVEVVGRVDISMEFFAFIIIAMCLMVYAWVTENNYHAGLWYAFSALFWIAVMYQWAVDHSGTSLFGLMFLFLAPFTFCVIQFIQKAWYNYDDIEERLRRRNSLI